MNIKRYTALAIAATATIAIAAAPASAQDQPPVFLPAKSNLGAVPVNAVASHQVVDYSLWQRDLAPGLVNTLRTPRQDSVTSWSVANGSLRLEDLDPQLQALVLELARKCGKKVK